MKTPVNRPQRDINLHIEFQDVKYLTSNEYTNIISFNDVYFNYGNTQILKNINMGISMKDRYVLIGNNGSGKSTFFKLCKGELEPTTGTINKDIKIRIGYFDQHSINNIPNDLTPIQYLKTIDSTLQEQEYRVVLAKMGFKKQYENDNFDVSKLLISELSGGQKVKLVMTGILMKKPHVLLFDEPSNHLDIYFIDELTNAINNFNGGIVIITHDGHIINNIENYKLLLLENNEMIHYNGTFTDYCDELDIE
jgi:ATPase subunit of ABC transporter with duplicated ATPase domains